MLAAQLLSPTAEDTLAFLKEHLHHRRYLLQLAGECEITYTGRAQSTAEAGDYLLIIKPDGCLMLHFELREDTSFLLSGSEADMQALLRQQPELIEPGLCLIDHELPTSVGSVDLFARDAAGNLVVIELKRGKATHEGVHQLARYVHKVRAPQTTQTPVRGVLVAPDATTPALKQLEADGLEFKKLTALPQLKRESPQTSLF